MAKLRLRCLVLICCLMALAAGLATTGCGGAAAKSGQATLGAQDAKNILRHLPYRYEFRNTRLPRGATSAIAGRAYGRHETWVDFGVAFGDHTLAVPVPGGGNLGAVGNPGFIFTPGLLFRDKNGHWAAVKQYQTAAQWREAIHMLTQMEERLCFAITGGPCPV